VPKQSKGRGNGRLPRFARNDGEALARNDGKWSLRGAQCRSNLRGEGEWRLPRFARNDGEALARNDREALARNDREP